MLVDTLNAFINDRAFLRRQSIATADDDLTQGYQEVGLIGDDLHRIAEQVVINRNVHRVYMMLAVRRNTDKLSVKRLHQRIIFALRIADDNIIYRGQEAVENLTLDRE